MHEKNKTKKNMFFPNKAIAHFTFKKEAGSETGK